MRMLPLHTCWTLSGFIISVGNEAQPSIGFILSDDHSYGGIGACGNQDGAYPES